MKAATAIERGAAKVVAADRRIALDERLGEERAAAFLARLPDQYLLAFDVETMCMHEELLATSPVVRCEQRGGQVAITVVADDRPGLLATLAGALTVCGLDVLEASLFGTNDGHALDVFRAADPFGRMADDDGAASRRRSSARSRASSTSRRGSTSGAGRTRRAARARSRRCASR